MLKKKQAKSLENLRYPDTASAKASPEVENIAATENFQATEEYLAKQSRIQDNLQKELNDLDKRFTKGDRDIGKTAIAKDKVIQRIINKASAAALRCVEISSGSPLTEKEINATKKSEINRECPSIANPNYIPY